MPADANALLVVVNPSAGSSDDEITDAVVAALKASGATVDVAATSDQADLANALAEHSNIDGVVVLGGDGSLHAVVQAMYDAKRLADAWIALIPLGTGNDFARTIGLPEDHAEATQLVATGRLRPLDLALTAEGEVVVNAIHVGVGADAASVAAPWKRRLGPIGYVIGAVVAGFVRPGVKLDVTVDDTLITKGRRVLQVAAGNGRFVGGGAALLPDADPADGQLDVLVVTAAARLRRLRYAIHLGRGDHEKLDDVRIVRGTTVHIRGAATGATNDGELCDPASTHQWRVVPAAWRLIVP